jgi:rod shape-determining protein MreC
MNNKNTGNGKTGLIILSVICIALIAVSFISSSAMTPLSAATGFVISPIQKGMNSLGSFLSGFSANMTDSAALREENHELREKVDTLTAENSKLVLDKEELERLQELLDLKEEYSEYDSIGARVISKGSGNWFNSFTIDKGTSDGISVDCNVMSGAGLVGIVTATGPNWSTVRAIIDDNSNVSAMISTTSDTCIIAGNLALIDEGTLSLVKLTDDNNHVHVGDKVVTSNISEKYLPGILIGYISELNNDANNLTKSGTVTPVVDFRHLQEVLVIRTLKQYVISDGETAPTLPAVPTGNQTILTAPRRQEGTGEAGTEADGSAREENAEAADQAEGADGSAQAEAAELSPEGGEAAADAENGGEGNAQ